MQAQEYLRQDRVDAITVNLTAYVRRATRAMAEANPENGAILADYIFAQLTERNIADSTREWKMKVLVWLSQTFSHVKSFRQMAKADILVHLNRLRKGTDVDPQQRGIGTYNNRVLVFTKFFRWLYNPDEPDYLKRATPPCMQGIKPQMRTRVDIKSFVTEMTEKVGYSHIMVRLALDNRTEDPNIFCLGKIDFIDESGKKPDVTYDYGNFKLVRKTFLISHMKQLLAEIDSGTISIDALSVNINKRGTNDTYEFVP